MSNDVEVTSDRVGSISNDAPCAKPVALLALESFEVVS